MPGAELLLIVVIFPVCPKHAALVLVALLVEDGALHLVVVLALSSIIVLEALHAVNHIFFVYF